MDLMLWASERGQMLSRTVKGMMMYATALAQLEYIETVDDRGDPDALAKAVEGKYRSTRHVCTAAITLRVLLQQDMFLVSLFGAQCSQAILCVSGEVCLQVMCMLLLQESFICAQL